MVRRLGPKRVALIGVAFGYVALFADAFIGHESNGGIDLIRQYVPLVFAPLAIAALLAVGLARTSERTLAGVCKVVGLLSIAIGLAGTYFHVHAVVEDLANDRLSSGAILGALTSGPPIAAPGGFVGVGLLLYALGLQRLSVTWRARNEPPE